MRAMIAWFARNSVAANLLMLFIVLAGLTTLPTIPQKPFPDIEIDVITVTVEYLGAGPEEVELGVCTRIEEEVEGVEGIEKINVDCGRRERARSRSSSSPGRTCPGRSTTSRTASMRSTRFRKRPRSRSSRRWSMQRPVIDIAISG